MVPQNRTKINRSYCEHGRIVKTSLEGKDHVTQIPVQSGIQVQNRT